MNTKLEFIKSRRFWGLIAIAVIGVLEAEGIILGEIAKAIYVVLGGFIGIRTLDKGFDALNSK